MSVDYDVIVIGTGAGGGVAAWEFARKGKRVLALDLGSVYPPGWTGRDHLRNHRYATYGHNTGPDLKGNPRVFVDANGTESTVRPNEGGYQNNAMALGGGTLVYGAQAWRFHPLDFQMATTYGIPEGSSLADWPYDLTELAPYYEEVEWEMGVSGGPPSSNLPGRRNYPMPAIPIHERGQRLAAAAQTKEWAHQRVPLLINSVERDGRGACIQCQHCVGFGCPTGAKAGSQNTILPKSGCDVWTKARVTRIATNPAGRVTGVEVMVAGERREVRADIVVVAAGAIESARLLLLSAHTKEPNGIGNGHDLVGRHLQGHYYPGAQGLFADPITSMDGPGPAVALTEFNHGNPGLIGGGMLADDFISLPVSFARDRRHPDVPRYGKAFKEWMRHGYRRSCHIIGPVQDIPNSDCRVTLDSHVRDSLGLPVARLSGTTHPETARTARFMRERAAEWLRAAGALDVWIYDVAVRMSAGQHQAGTCRMGTDPSNGVVDHQGRVFGHDNLLVCDGSVHVTNGGFNPVLTILATALRSARLHA